MERRQSRWALQGWRRPKLTILCLELWIYYPSLHWGLNTEPSGRISPTLKKLEEVKKASWLLFHVYGNPSPLVILPTGEEEKRDLKVLFPARIQPIPLPAHST
jgi:hypothetical protein